MSQNAVVTLVIRAKDSAAAVITNVRARLRGITTEAQAMGAGLERESSRGARALGGLGDMAKRVGGFFGAMFALEKVREAADEWKIVEGQLRLVTRSTAELRDTQAQLFQLAQATRSPYQATAELYARVRRSTRELNLEQRDYLGVTEAVNRAIMTSGLAGTRQAELGVIQLSQAFARGVLQGQDLRAVMEDIPGVGVALADSLGVSIGKLREMGTAGELTSRVLINGLLKALPKLRDESAQMPMTIGQAFTQLHNAFTKWVGETDRGFGASSALASGISLLARNIGLLANAALIAGVGKLVGVLSRVTAPMRDAISAAAEEQRAIARGTAVQLQSAEAIRQRTAASVQAAEAETQGAATAIAALRAEEAEIRSLIAAEEARRIAAAQAAGAATATSTGAPAYLSGVARNQNAAASAARTAALEAESVATANLAALNQRLAATTADAAAIERVAAASEVERAAAMRAAAAANIQEALTSEATTVAVVAQTVATRVATVATNVFKTALAMVGGPIGLLITGIITVGMWLFNVAERKREAAQAAREHAEAMQHEAAEAAEGARQFALQNDELDRQIAALKRGGLGELEKAKRAKEAVDLAADQWQKWADKNKEAAEASESFEEALKREDSMARALYNTAVEQVRKKHELADAEDRARKATEERQKQQEKDAHAPEEAHKQIIASLTDQAALLQERIKLNDDAAGAAAEALNTERMIAQVLAHGNVSARERVELMKSEKSLADSRHEAGFFTIPERADQNRDAGLASLKPPTPVAPSEDLANAGLFKGIKQDVADATKALDDMEPPGLSKTEALAWRLSKALKSGTDEGKNLDRVIADITTNTLQGFASAVETAMAAWVDGSQSAGRAFTSAMLGAIAQVASGFGQFFLASAIGEVAKALAAAASGNPAGAAGHYAAAAEYTAGATAMFAISGALQGAAHRASGGGAGGGGSASDSAQQNNTDLTGSKGEAVLIIEGGLLDMSDPRQEQALARAIEDLDGRRVIVRRNG